jgi:hypothetical protein
MDNELSINKQLVARRVYMTVQLTFVAHLKARIKMYSCLNEEMIQIDSGNITAKARGAGLDIERDDSILFFPSLACHCSVAVVINSQCRHDKQVLVKGTPA